MYIHVLMDLYCNNIIAIEKKIEQTKPKIQYLLFFFPDEPENCQDIFERGYTTSGIYTIYLRDECDKDFRAVDVFCDMETLDGGWTVSINY